MTLPPDPSKNPPQHQHQFQPGYWYELHGYDWYFTEPIRRDGQLGSHISNEDLDEDELPPHLHDAEEIHYILLDIQYGLLDELPQEAGVCAAFAYLLQTYLEARSLNRTTPTPHPDTAPGNTTPPAIPSISVIAGKSYIEISARAATPAELHPIWEDLAHVLADPKQLYHQPQPAIASNSMNLVREAGLLIDALRYRSRHYAGALWHNDVTLRTGLNGAALAPLDTTHAPRRILPAIDALAHRLNPTEGKTRHSFRTTHPSLMGAAFTTPPKPWSIEDFLADSDERHLAYEHGGTLETDDSDALLSVSFPLTLSNMMTAVLLAQIIAQIAHETVGERAVLRADRYVYGEDFVVTFAMGGDWATEDGRAILTALMRVPVDGEDVLPEVTLSQFMDDFRLDGHYESVLYSRRAEREDITTELIRTRLYECFERFHLPDPLVKGDLRDKYPPLVDPIGLRVAYGSGQGAAFPPPLEQGDLERDFLEPGGSQFMSRCRLGAGKYPYLAPHRLSLADDGIVGEWFAEEDPSTALVRRLAVRWVDLRAWFSIGEATALMDFAGRVLFVLPTLYDRVGELYSALDRQRERVKTQVLHANGGEADLRFRVREMVSYRAQQQVRDEVAHSVKHGVRGEEATRGNPAPAAGEHSPAGTQLVAPAPDLAAHADRVGYVSQPLPRRVWIAGAILFGLAAVASLSLLLL